jgi:deoxyribodipyrimidine photo-lyase
VDADPANNPASWQWVAGSGADAAPYFRVFNPELQREKFDPHGDYVRRYVPELAEATGRSPLANTGYPQPLVKHADARARALEAFGKTRD